MAVKEGEKHFSNAIYSILEQQVDTPWELVLAVSDPSGQTQLMANGLASSFGQRLQIIPNPLKTAAHGLQACLSVARFRTVIRVDAHSKLSDGYASIAQQILTESGAANVGGMMVAEGEGDFQKAVAYGYNNRIGLGGGSFHVGGKAGPVDTVYLGCFQRAWLDKVGGYDPKWVRGQDWELNKRIREAGGTVWFDPRLKVTYFPRDNWLALAKQFFNTGIWRGALTREAPGQSAFRYWLPPLLVLSTLLWLPVTIYLLVIAFAAVNANELNPISRLWLMIVLPTMHYAWGIGFWWGLIRGAK